MLALSRVVAKQLQLHALSLVHSPTKPATRVALINAIKRMSLLQIDTISVVNRSPYLVLYARLGAYPLDWLEDCLRKRAIFEVWAHEACFAPREDLALLHNQLRDRRHWSQAQLQRALREHGPAMRKILQQIQNHGPMRSADFERPELAGGKRKSQGWWDWKPEKRWLEAWFTAGRLMVTRREGFQRFYDLSERVYPELAQPNFIDSHLDPLQRTSARLSMAAKGLQAIGISRGRWLNDFYRLSGQISELEIDQLIEAGVCVPVEVEPSEHRSTIPAQGKGQRWLLHKSWVPLAKRLMDNREAAPTLTVPLSPFDPLVWQRERVADLFDFDYRIECYTPEAKRRYGYFTLPLLHRGELVGRIDAKAHRQLQQFEVKSLHLEHGYKVQADDLLAFAKSIHAMALWHDCPNVVWGAVIDAKGRPQKQTARNLSRAVLSKS